MKYLIASLFTFVLFGSLWILYTSNTSSVKHCHCVTDCNCHGNCICKEKSCCNACKCSVKKKVFLTIRKEQTGIAGTNVDEISINDLGDWVVNSWQIQMGKNGEVLRQQKDRGKLTNEKYMQIIEMIEKLVTVKVNNPVNDLVVKVKYVILEDNKEMKFNLDYVSNNITDYDNILKVVKGN